MSKFNPKNYWENRLKRNFGLDGVGCLKQGKCYNNWLYKIRENVFIRRVKAVGINFNKVTVLDIGSGTGFYIDRWKDLGVKTIVGADIASAAIKELKQRYPDKELYQLDIGDNVEIFKERKFNVVSAFDILFHIVDDKHYEKAIRNIYSMLKPGGFFIFSENFLHRETVRETTKVKYQVCRSLSVIKKILEDAGFKIIERTPMFVLMNHPIDSKNYLWRMLWRIMAKIISINEFSGFLFGAILYPLELICLSLIKEGPSTEMMICKKPE